MSKKRLVILVASILVTFITLRVWLHWSPNSDFDVLGYNIHHLYTGFLVMVIAGIPLMMTKSQHFLYDLLTAVFGSGLSMVLDEWVYLIVTDGSNASYLLPVSFWGGAVMVVLMCIYIVFMQALIKNKE